MLEGISNATTTETPVADKITAKRYFARKIRYPARTILAILVLSCVAFAAISLYPRVFARSVQAESVSAAEPLGDVATSQPQKDGPNRPMKSEVIVLTPRGFEPNLIRRGAGKVLLVIVNDSEMPTLTLRAESADGAFLRFEEMRRNKRRWNLPVDLPAGRFQIMDIEHPEHTLRIEAVKQGE